MFCIHCGAANPDHAKFCNACGKQSSTRAPVPAPEPDVVLRTFSSVTTGRGLSPSSAPERGGRWIGWLTLGLLCLIGIGLWTHFSGQTSGEVAGNYLTYRIGQPFSTGYWSYICNGASRTPFLGDSISLQRANGVFVVVDLTVRNNDTSSSTLPRFQLVDGQGRRYDQSTAVMLSDRFFGVLESLNPGVTERRNIAFDVPPDRDYSLLVSGGIESDERAIVLLPNRPQLTPEPGNTDQ